MMQNICEPVCTQGCISGKCVAPETCECLEDYENSGDGICVPVCNDDCSNGKCVLPNICLCDPGYVKDRDDKCEPECSINCTINGKCIAPKVCECNQGYAMDLNGMCAPVCSDGCVNGICLAPEECVCLPGFERVYSECERKIQTTTTNTIVNPSTTTGSTVNPFTTTTEAIQPTYPADSKESSIYQTPEEATITEDFVTTSQEFDDVAATFAATTTDNVVEAKLETLTDSLETTSTKNFDYTATTEFIEIGNESDVDAFAINKRYEGIKRSYYNWFWILLICVVLLTIIILAIMCFLAKAKSYNVAKRGEF